MQTTLAHPIRRWRRPAYALLAVSLLAAVVAAVAKGQAEWWMAVAFGLGPDVALLLGAGRGLEKGQLHPRAVPLYNVLHRFWGPVALAAVAAAGTGLAGLPRRGARLGVPHRARPLGRLRAQGTRWLPAPLSR